MWLYRTGDFAFLLDDAMLGERRWPDECHPPRPRRTLSRKTVRLRSPPGLLGFVQETFAAEVVEHSPDGGEVEVRIGDSAIAHLDWDELTDLIEDRHAMIARRS